jgi:hypothetical protein
MLHYIMAHLLMVFVTMLQFSMVSITMLRVSMAQPVTIAPIGTPTYRQNASDKMDTCRQKDTDKIGSCRQNIGIGLYSSICNLDMEIDKYGLENKGQR